MLNDYLEKLIEIFNLQQWEIQLVVEKVMEDNCVGITDFVNNDYKAVIKIKEDTDYNMLETLVHEIVHIIKRNSQLIAMDCMDNQNTKDVFNIWYREMEREQQVLAKGIIKLLNKGIDDEI